MYTYQARIIKVIDGDTFDAEIDLGFKIWKRDRFRLFGYSAPEIHGDEKPYGLIAKKELEKLLGVRELHKIVTSKPDKYGRWLVDAYDDIGESLSKVLIDLKYGVFWDGQSPRPAFDFTNYPKE